MHRLINHVNHILEANPTIYIDDYEFLKQNDNATMKMIGVNQPIVVVIEVTEDFYNLYDEIYEEENGLYVKSNKSS